MTSPWGFMVTRLDRTHSKLRGQHRQKDRAWLHGPSACDDISLPLSGSDCYVGRGLLAGRRVHGDSHEHTTGGQYVH